MTLLDRWLEIVGRYIGDGKVSGMLESMNEIPVRVAGSLGDRIYVKFARNGVEINTSFEQITSIILFVKPTEKYQAYSEDLFEGHWRDWTIEDVLRSMGEPNSQSNGLILTSLGKSVQWMKFSVAGKQAHFEFDSLGGILKISLMGAGAP